MSTDEERLQSAQMCAELNALGHSFSLLYIENQELKQRIKELEEHNKKAWDEGYRAGVDDERDIPL